MSIEDRLARLERENRRLKIAGLLVLAVVGSVFAMGQARPATEMTAQRFVLTDSSGQRAGEFMVGADGYPGLYLYEPGQQYPTIFLDVAKLGQPGTVPTIATRLFLWAPHTGTGKGGFTMDVMDGTTSFVMNDHEGRGRIQATYAGGTDPIVRVLDPSFHPLWSAP
jgi:hypothetical protein